MSFKKAVCYSFSLSERDSLAHLRLIAPLRQSGIEIINGIENHQVYNDRILDGDFVIIQREFPKDYTNYKKILKIARLERKPVVYDIDDLLFYLPENHPDRSSGRYGISLLPMLQALIEADLVSVTTSQLRNFVLDYNEKVALLPNFLDDNLWQIQQEREFSTGESLTIGYMGGITHKPDVEYLTPVFIELHRLYGDRIRFKFWGLQPPDQIISLPQVEWYPSTSNTYEDFSTFFQSQSADIFIAPLIDTQFNRCKSPIKFLEYSALGVPGVYSRLDTYTDVINHGHNGFLASSHDEWIKCLVELIDDERLRSNLAKNALETIRSQWLLSNNYTMWLEAYERAFKNASVHSGNDEKLTDLFTSINQQLYETYKNHEFVLNETSVKLIETETKVSDLTSLVEKQDLEIQTLNNQIVGKEKTIKDLLNQVVGSKENIENLQKAIVEKENAILEFSAKLEDEEKRISALTREISENTEIIQELTTLVRDDKNNIQVMSQRATEKEQEERRLLNIVNQQEKELGEIYISRAWKLALYIRRMRILLVPPGSRRSRIFQKLILFLRIPFFRNIKLFEEMALIRSSPLYNEKYYKAHNPDITRAKIDPVFHYLRHGGFEGRAPGPHFSSAWYLKAYPDVKETGVNPLIHYIKYGKDEGRLPSTNDDSTRTVNLFVNQQEFQAIPLIQKVIHAWKEGGIPLVWQKTHRKINWVLKKQQLISTQKQLDFADESILGEQVKLAELSYQPLISVIMPTYNTPSKYLNAAVDSVLAQFYPHWEMIICDDASSDRATREEISKIAELDERIKVIYLSENKGISVATNKAAEVAGGEYLAFLDHDDELTEDALFEMVIALNTGECADVLYSDQDKIDSSGRVHEPFFKPDWSPIYLRSVMYVGHLLLVKREVFQHVNGMNSLYDGVQDYEFMLRVAETNPRVKHIPKILYHWRKIPGSVAMGLDEKGSVIEILQVEAVKEHLSRLELTAIATRHPIHRHRVLIQPKPRVDNPLVSIIILTKDAPDLIERCLGSIFSLTTYPNYEVIVVDNESTDPKAIKILDNYAIKVVPFNEPFNFSKANNIGVQQSKGDYIVLLNNDTEIVSPDWIEQLLFYCEQSEVGIVGPLLVYPDRTVQHAGIVLGLRGTADHVMRHFPFDSDGYAGSLSCPREVTSITAACLMIKRGEYLEAGQMVEYYGTHYQDVDLCLRVLKRGKCNLFVPNAILIHYEGATRGKLYDHMDRALLLDIWGETIERGDPYYNPNFSLKIDEFYTVG